MLVSCHAEFVFLGSQGAFRTAFEFRLRFAFRRRVLLQ
jgi:hypothetical protein